MVYNFKHLGVVHFKIVLLLLLHVVRSLVLFLAFSLVLPSIYRDSSPSMTRGYAFPATSRCIIFFEVTVEEEETNKLRLKCEDALNNISGLCRSYSRYFPPPYPLLAGDMNFLRLCARLLCGSLPHETCRSTTLVFLHVLSRWESRSKRLRKKKGVYGVSWNLASWWPSLQCGKWWWLAER
uniref:Uncharacterized protein TCIL3000_7_4650 n=1 Tax=Trypanosoma congolense (strain IL3000) TaxID=1068625 RepID=G0UQJ0_TRYCI|nr:unnamed protein product [Trypanosoma congolense IL3000]